MLLAPVVSAQRYIPTNAFKYAAMVRKEEIDIFPSFKYKPYFMGLVEQESCIYLTSPLCWNPNSRLKTTREEGAGLSQLTRAYRKNGTIRFDTIRTLRNKYNRYLKELTWRNVYQRPDLQISAMILLWRESYQALPKNVSNGVARIAMADAAYNGGLRGVRSDRRLCGLKKGCNPDLWFNNVSTTCSKSKRILYGNRNACDINRTHVTNTILKKYNKYGILYYFLDDENGIDNSH